MGFRRGQWSCAVKTCTHEGAYSVIVHMRTAAGRKERVQKVSPALRICQIHMDAIKKGKLPAEIVAAAQAIAKKICGEQ